jgi:hypothetical protein
VAQFGVSVVVFWISARSSRAGFRVLLGKDEKKESLEKKRKKRKKEIERAHWKRRSWIMYRGIGQRSRRGDRGKLR